MADRQRRTPLDWALLVTGAGALVASVYLALTRDTDSDAEAEAQQQLQLQQQQELRQGLATARAELSELAKLANSLLSKQQSRMDELETSLATTAAREPAAQKELLMALKAELKAELRTALEQQLAPAIEGQLLPTIEHRLAAAIDEKLPNAIAQQVPSPQQHLPPPPPAEDGSAAQPVASEGGAAALLAAHAVRKDRLKAELDVTLEGTPVGTAGSAQPPTPAASATEDLAACGSSEAARAPTEQAANGSAGSPACSGAGSSAWHATLGATNGSRDTQVATPAAAHAVPFSPAAPIFTPPNGQLSATAATFTPTQTTPAQTTRAQTPPPSVECGGVGGATAAVAGASDASCSSQAAPSLTDVMRLMQEGKQASLPHTQPIDDQPLVSPPPASLSSLRPQAKPWERPFLPMPGTSPMMLDPASRIEELPH